MKTFVIPQSTLDRLISRWLNSKVDTIESEPYLGGSSYTIKTKRGNELFGVYFDNSSLTRPYDGDTIHVKVVPDQLNSIYDIFPLGIHFNEIMDSIKRYFKDPSRRKFKFDEDHLIDDGTKVIVFTGE
jgi:hypothetical protein